MPKLDKAEVENITAEDMRDYMYGSIQGMIQGNVPKNVIFQYFMPPIPFGPELAAFMDIGPKAKEWKDAGFTINDLMRSAINFATMVDYVPVVDSEAKGGASDGDIVDINTLISSGTKVSNLYDSILNNVRVFDNKRPDEDEEKLKKLRALLYKDAPDADVDTAASDADVDSGIDAELAADSEDVDDLDIDDLTLDEDEFDLDSVLDDGLGTDDFVVNPDAISEPTIAMKLYDALQYRYDQVQLSVADELKKISPNDPNASLRKKVLLRKMRAAKQRWETQGRKTKIRSIIARIEQLSQGGMPEYLAELKNTFEGNKILASLFADEELGVSLLSESAYYTALRPNGVLSAASTMKVSIKNSSSQNWSKLTRNKTSAGFKAPAILWFGGAKASGSKLDQRRQSEFMSSEFEISFEIVQGLIDRPWLDKSFLECRAYTTVDPRDNSAIDPIMQITSLSDGMNPPTGQMAALPVTVYFIRNLTLRSSAFKSLSDQEINAVKGKGSVGIFGFGSSAGHENKTIETNFSKARTEGEITADGTYLVAMSSVFMKKSPDPDFDAFPKDKWI